MHLTACCAFKC